VTHGTTRRTFVLATGAAAVLAVTGCGGSDGGGFVAPDKTVLFRRSSHGLRNSNAAKSHAANHRYVSLAAAAADLAHPGDTCQVVRLRTRPAVWDQLFAAGNASVDLRALPAALRAVVP
jgi:hypothetical protein